MPGVLRNTTPTRNLTTDLRRAALTSLIIVLPFAFLEALNNTVTGQNAPDIIVLFGLLWLLPAAFVLLLVPSARAVREGGRFTAHPFSLLWRVTLLAFIALTWASILFDQMPCLLGVPNCD
jgi:hypothetical protein